MTLERKDSSPDDLVLVQLRGMRREFQAVIEQQARLFEYFSRLQGQIAAFRDEIRADVNTIRSDILLLEGQNASRHGEILNLMRQIEDETGDN